MAGRIPTKAEIVEVENMLTSAEADLLVECERAIETGRRAFVSIGRSLTAVRDNRLYRATFANFEEYCQQRWDISRPRAYELIAAVAALSGIPDNLPVPTSAQQALELAAVPEADRADVWSTVLDRTTGNPTAAAIEAERKAREAQAEDPAHSGATPAGVEPRQDRKSPANTKPKTALKPEPHPVKEDRPAAESEPEPDVAAVEPDEAVKPAVEKPRARGKKAVPDSSPVAKMLASSKEAQAQEFMKNFNGALYRAGDLFGFDAARVAALADEGEIESIERHIEYAQKFLADVKAHRPAKLRLVGGTAS